MLTTKLKIFVIILLAFEYSRASEYPCSVKSTLLLFKRHVYNFSMDILERVNQETNGHFVFSPLSTWLQMGALAEGAKERTLREIRKVTKHTAHKCFKFQLSKILKKMNKDLAREYRRKSLMIADRLMGVRKYYINNVRRLYGTKVFLENYDNPNASATAVNKLLASRTGGVFNEAIYSEDFQYTSLLMTDANYFRSSWKSPFDPSATAPANFTAGKYVGTVNMMHLLGNFYYTDNPFISADVLELPFVDERISFLVFLPNRGRTINDLFFNLRHTTLTSIFNMFNADGPQLMSVSLPRFKIHTEVENLPELIYDMGIKRIFKPDLSELGNIGENLHISLMTQLADIEVTESGVTAQDNANFLVKDAKDFVANQTFAYIIVDKVTEFILYAGIYSAPWRF